MCGRLSRLVELGGVTPRLRLHAPPLTAVRRTSRGCHAVKGWHHERMPGHHGPWRSARNRSCCHRTMGYLGAVVSDYHRVVTSLAIDAWRQTNGHGLRDGTCGDGTRRTAWWCCRSIRQAWGSSRAQCDGHACCNMKMCRAGLSCQLDVTHKLSGPTHTLLRRSEVAHRTPRRDASSICGRPACSRSATRSCRKLCGTSGTP